MKIVIAGAGEVGTYLAKMFCDSKHDVVLIDTDESKLKLLDSHLDLLTVPASATSIGALKNANVKNAHLFIAVTHYEDPNITAAILAKKLGAKKTIARIRNQEYLLPANREHFKSLGIDELIHPPKLAAREVISLLKQSGTSKIFEFSGGKLTMLEVRLDAHAPIIGKTLIEVVTQMVKDYEFRVVAITRRGETIIPRGNDKFNEYDQINVITSQSSIKSLMTFFGKEEIEIKDIMILGGSRIGQRIAKELEGQFNIKLLEIDKEKSFRLADLLDKTLVINADSRNVNILKEEGIQNMDAVIAVTGNAEINILSCLLAKRFGVKKTIVEIENIDYISLAENMGIDTIINKKRTAASYIFRFMFGENVTSVQCLQASDAEVLEFEVSKNAKITKDILKNIHFPSDAIIGGIVRGKSSFIATGETFIQSKDKVVVFALPSAINKVVDYF